ncbi:MAG: hypothetical protein WB799_18250 [Candidatus Sulfotelmatobacter sp.]
MKHMYALLAVLGMLTSIQLVHAQAMTTMQGINNATSIQPAAWPDPTIAVGTLEFCENVNSAYQCWYKSTHKPVSFFGTTTPKSDKSIWTQNSNNSGNTPNCSNPSPNAQILHDNVYNLWVLQRRVYGPSTGHQYMCIAISTAEDVSSPSFNWFAYELDLDSVIPTNAKGDFYYPDYPQAGLWQTSTSSTAPYTPASDQAMWISYDLTDPDNNYNIDGVLICAVDLAGLRASTVSPWSYNGQTPACTVAHSLVAFNQRRSWVPANNSDSIPPLTSDGEMFTYMIEPARGSGNYLTNPEHTQGVEQWTINWSAATPAPTFVNSWDLPSTQAGGDQLACFNRNNYYSTVCIPQPSTSNTGIYIDSVGDRMQQFFHYTSNGGQGGVWTSSHAIQIKPNASVLSQTEADIRVLQWNSSNPAAIYVAEDYPLIDPNDPNAYVFLPSVARDRVGNLRGVVALSGTSSSEHPGLDSVYYSAGGSGWQSYGYIATPSADGDAEDTDSLNYRWGNWSGAVLDPSDSCTVWTVGEFLPENRTTEPYWSTEIAQLPPASNCPIAFFQVKPFTPRSASSDSITYNKSQSAGDLNIVVVGWHDITSTIVSVQDSNGNTYQLGAPLMRSGKGATALSQAIYYASNIVGGTNTVTITFNQAAYGADIRMLEYSGVQTLDAYAGAAGTGTLAKSGSAVIHASNELIFGADLVTTVTSGPGTGFTSRVITSGDGDIAEDEIVNMQGSYGATAPLTTSGGWIMQMLSFSN